MTHSVERHPSSWVRPFIYYALLTALLIAPSATLWFRTPFNVLGHNFDYFCGLIQVPGWSAITASLVSRGTQSALLIAMGFLFYRLAMRHGDAIEAASPRAILAACGTILVIHLCGLPWMNPDLFFPIGKGWLDLNYNVDPYRYPIAALGASTVFGDPMFTNIDPPLFRNTGNYGPLHNSLSVALVGLSGGNIIAAAFLFKAFNLLCLIGSAWVLHAIALREGLKAKHLVFTYLCNPIVPLALVAWGHNDAQQNVLLLLALLFVYKDKPACSGAFLGAAISLKFVALVTLPALILYWWLARQRRPGSALNALGACAFVMVITFASYDGIWTVTKSTFDVSWSPLRSSIYSFFEPIGKLMGWQGIATAKTVMSAVYVLAGAIITFGLLWKRDVRPIDLVKAVVWIFNFYFLLAAPAVLEWYLTWNLACVLLLPTHFRFFAVLVSVFMPLVSFSLYLPFPVVLGVSMAHYLLYVFCVTRFAPWRGDFEKCSQNAESQSPPQLQC